MTFRDRRDAGRQLADALRVYAERRPLVLGLPRGGVVVAAEVAAALGAPLDLLVVRKLGVPGHEELAMGAIASGGFRHLNEDIADTVPAADVGVVVARERAELQRREAAYRQGAPRLALDGRTVILVDDGLATGATMAVAVEAARAGRAKFVVVAAPVAAPETVRWMRTLADDVVVLDEPRHFLAVGSWYVDFRATTDDEVLSALAANRGS